MVGQEGVTKNMYQMINRSALGHGAPGKLVDEAVLDRVQSWQLGRPEGRNRGRGFGPGEIARSRIRFGQLSRPGCRALPLSVALILF